MSAPDDPRERLAQLVIRLRAAPVESRPAVVEELLAVLADDRIPLPVRMAATGRAIDSLPDTVRAIRGVVRAITAGLSPAHALHRLRHLQHLTEQGTALDSIVARRERKVKMSCPRCGVRLPRAEMAKHLWHEHGLTLVAGKTRSRKRAVEAIQDEYVTLGDPALFDRVAELGGEAAVRAWAAETASEEEALLLCASARERGVGLCPACFADIPPLVPALPPPLAVAQGRVAGDGYVAVASGVFPARWSATLAGVLVLLACVWVRWFELGIALAGLTYFAALALCTPRGSLNDRAIDGAWRKLAHRLADRRDAGRFLTRLCVTSMGRGDPMERANTLSRVIARARDNPAERQLLAVALALQIDDGGRFGRDRSTGLAELVATAFRGEQSADFAEFVLSAYLSVPREPHELARLRILLLAAAFAADLTPRALIDLSTAAPRFGDIVRLPHHHLALLYGVWTHRVAEPWAEAGPARTVFELAKSAPTTAGKLLMREPGLLLVCNTPPEVEAELGPVLVAAGGVSVGGALLSDPAAEVGVEAGGRELVFGKQVFRLNQPIAEEFADELKDWLRFRAETLAAYPTMYLRGESRSALRLLAPFTARCPSCGTECLPVVGAVARTPKE